MQLLAQPRLKDDKVRSSPLESLNGAAAMYVHVYECGPKCVPTARSFNVLIGIPRKRVFEKVRDASQRRHDHNNVKTLDNGLLRTS